MSQALVFVLTFFLVVLPTNERKAIYSRLDRDSLSKQLAFYRLFPETDEGKRAYTRACHLLKGENQAVLPPIPPALFDSLVNAVAASPSAAVTTFSEEEIQVIHSLGSDFSNRKLQGGKLKEEHEILKLPPEEIDLARALLVSQGGDIERLEAIFDIMALHIRARLPQQASHLEKIHAMTTFIFDEMGFRFPPQSAFIPDIDKYTSLPSVVDSRKGVCLGVSILYISLAQRLDLPLKIITPPGHIFVRYEGEGGSLNIETTARGVHIPDRAYLNLEYQTLEHRTIKEVVGMAYMNESSIHWKSGNYEKALQLYEKALPYMPEDPLLHELMGYISLFLKQDEAAKKHFEKAELKPTSFASDWLENRCDTEAIELLFHHEDKTRQDLLAYRSKVEKSLEKWPNFKAGWFYHASTCLELGRWKEALVSLEKYHDLYPHNRAVEFLLIQLYLERGQFCEGWKHFKILTSLFPTPPSMIEDLRVKLLEKSYPCG